MQEGLAAPILWPFSAQESHAGVYLVAGPQASGKTTLINQELYHSLDEGHRVLYVAVDAPPVRVGAAFASFGWNLRPFVARHRLAFVDCYVWHRGMAEAVWEAGPYRTRPYYIANPKNLPELAQVMHLAQQEFAFDRVMLDSLTSLLADVALPVVEHFLGDFAQLARESGAGWATVNTDSLPVPVADRLKAYFDALVELKLLEAPHGKQPFFRTSALNGGAGGTSWSPYRITTRGIDFLSPRVGWQQRAKAAK